MIIGSFQGDDGYFLQFKANYLWRIQDAELLSGTRYRLNTSDITKVTLHSLYLKDRHYLAFEENERWRLNSDSALIDIAHLEHGSFNRCPINYPKAGEEIVSNYTSDSPSDEATTTAQAPIAEQPRPSVAVSPRPVPVETPQYEVLSYAGGVSGKYRAIGLNAQEAFASFGKYPHTNQDRNTGQTIFACQPDNNTGISIEFCNNIVCLANFFTIDQSNLSETFIRQLLRDNSMSMQWKKTTIKGRPGWERSDGQLYAALTDSKILTIYSVQWQEMIEAYQGTK